MNWQHCFSTSLNREVKSVGGESAHEWCPGRPASLKGLDLRRFPRTPSRFRLQRRRPKLGARRRPRQSTTEPISAGEGLVLKVSVARSGNSVCRHLIPQIDSENVISAYSPCLRVAHSLTQKGPPGGGW